MATYSEETNAPRLMTVMWVMVGIALIFMVFRFACKRLSGKRFFVDDYILTFAWVCAALYATFITVACQYGMGRHLDTLDHHTEVETHRFLAISYFFATLGLPVSKSSVALTLLRLSQQRWQKIILWFIICSMNVILWITAIFLFTSCSPVERIFDPKAPGKCLNTGMIMSYNKFASGYSSAMDFVLVIFPWYLIWGLNMKTVEKLGICVAMSFGILSGIAGFLHVSYMGSGAKWKDWTWNTTNIIWGASETCLVIIAASIPFLRKAFKEATRARSNRTGGASGSHVLTVGQQSGSHVNPGEITTWSGSDDGTMEEKNRANKAISVTRHFTVESYSRPRDVEQGRF